MIDDNDVTTSEFEGEQKPTETTVQSEPAKKEDKGLSNREAAQQAIQKHRPEIKFEKKDAPEPTKAEVTAAVEAEIEPPAGFKKDEIEAWKNKDVQGIQKAFRRMHEAKTQEMSRAQAAEKQAREEANKEKEEAKTWREFGAMAAPYIEAQGLQGVTPQQAMMNALNLIAAFKKADPATAKAELKALGIDLDKGSETQQNVPKELLEKIEGLQKWKSDTESLLEKRRFEGVVENYKKAYETLDSFKTRTGEKVFPDLLDEQFCSSNEGKLFHTELGSLTKDPIFIKGVFRRFPEADFTTVCREAYIALGGKVTGAPVTVSSNNQNDIYKKSRAAASTPGKPAARADTASLKGKLGRRAATKKALEIHGWEN